jgi:hypothetical protein
MELPVPKDCKVVTDYYADRDPGVLVVARVLGVLRRSSHPLTVRLVARKASVEPVDARAALERLRESGDAHALGGGVWAAT